MHDSKARVFVVEDHPVMREGIVSMINREQDMAVCGEAEDVAPALVAMREAPPTVVLIDLRLKSSSGFDLMTELVRETPGVRIVGMTMLEGSQYERKARAAGALAFFNKQDGVEKLIVAIRSVLPAEAA